MATACSGVMAKACTGALVMARTDETEKECTGAMEMARTAAMAVTAHAAAAAVAVTTELSCSEVDAGQVAAAASVIGGLTIYTYFFVIYNRR
jgi:hypothetical protein